MLDVNSGAVHVVDDIVYDVIPYLEQDGETPASIRDSLEGKYPEEEIKAAMDECQELKENGLLFTEDRYRPAIEDFKKRPTVVKALCLHIAHDCNLACQYCFAEEGEYHGRRALMSFEVGKKALDFLIANSGNRRNLEVDFFGGEPLMNWQVVKDLVRYGREQEKIHDKNFRFTLTTNGVLLNDEIMEFCNREMGNVVLSLDGRKEVNDKMRPFRNGKGSYDLIVPKFQKFADSRNQQKYYVRGTFTHNNLDFSEDVLHLADLGFKQISVEPVVAHARRALRHHARRIFRRSVKNMTSWRESMIKREKEGRGFNFFHFMIDLTGGPCVAQAAFRLRLRNRVSGSYPLGRFLSLPSVRRKREVPYGQRGRRASFIRRFGTSSSAATSMPKKNVRNCFARFYCSGGCAANSYNFHGSINDAYDIGCELRAQASGVRDYDQSRPGGRRRIRSTHKDA